MLIDVTRLVARQMQGRLPTGVDRVALEYVRHFQGQGCALIRWRGRWVTLSRQDSAALFAALGTPARGFGRQVTGRVGKALLTGLVKHVPRGTVLLNLGHSGLDDPEYGNKIDRLALRSIFFLHDLIPITHPEYARTGEAVRHARRVETMLRHARGIVANSRYTLDALHTFVHERGLPVPPCVVAPLGVPRLPSPQPAAPIAKPYFVVLSTIEPRKNHLLLLHLWRALTLDFGDTVPRLVLIGQRGWECEQVVDLLERCPALQTSVIQISKADDAELATWLYHARALLFPSFVEGYGLPLVEALSLGTPVIASDLSVFRELAGDIPDYLDPLDGLGWRRLILDYAQPDSAYRAAQIERMHGYHPPTWEEHFRIVEEFLQQIGLRARL